MQTPVRATAMRWPHGLTYLVLKATNQAETKTPGPSYNLELVSELGKDEHNASGLTLNRETA